MKVKLIAIDKLIPYSQNPRKNESAIAKVAASIREFGFRQPIVVDSEYVVIAGHTRLLAAKQLGIIHIPVHIAEDLTDAQIKAYRIADNRTNEEATWDDELLKIELGDLEDKGFNLELTGFDTDELDRLMLHTQSDDLEDEIPSTPNEAITKTGDLWHLGKHRLLCGDSLDSKVIDYLLDGDTVEMTFTDPPYNVDYASEKGDKIHNDNLGDEFYSFLLQSCHNMFRVCTGAVYICMSASEIHTLQQAFKAAEGHWSTFIIWAKNHFTLGRSDYQRQYETILYGWKEGNKRHWCGDRNQSDVWEFAKPTRNDLHPTMKPVELVMRAIENSSKIKDIILDPFAGSGSTLIACEKLNRVARLIEIDPKYCDVIVRRWENATGLKGIQERKNK